MYYNIGIGLFGQFNVENAEVKQIIHVCLAQLTMSATPQKSYGQ